MQPSGIVCSSCMFSSGLEGYWGILCRVLSDFLFVLFRPQVILALELSGFVYSFCLFFEPREILGLQLSGIVCSVCLFLSICHFWRAEDEGEEGKEGALMYN